ncbi:MAG: response regulator [bacterium]|nr:response regulator [bacterium]
MARSATRSNLLIIDDEEIVREPTRRLLERSGYGVRVAANGPTGLEILTGGHPPIDLVLLDLSMPSMSGHEVLAELRRLRPDIKVIIITGYATLDDEVHGADGILQKPFTVVDLLQRINKVLAS